MSPNPNKAIRGCGPLSTPGFFDRLSRRYNTGGIVFSFYFPSPAFCSAAIAYFAAIPVSVPVITADIMSTGR